MNPKFFTRFSCVIILFSSFLYANNKWDVKCEEKCSSCTSSCTPNATTYSFEQTYETEGEANDAAAVRESDFDETCTVTEQSGSSGGGGQSTADTSPGLTSLSFDRAGMIFDGVSPDYVKYETVSETVTQTVNGEEQEVTVNVKKPIQLPVSGSTIFYSDIIDDQDNVVGFQSTRYSNSQISVPDSNGFRTIPEGALPMSITSYRHPEGTPSTDMNTIDVIHKQRHPQSGAWVTRTIRRFAPQGNNNWKTEFYLGDPSESNLIQPYREINVTRTPNNDGTESVREITKDRDSSGSMVTTSDMGVTYAFYKYGFPVRVAETKHTGTGSELTTTSTYFTDASEQASYNKPATTRRSDGQWADYTYEGSTVTGILVTKTVSGWLDNPAPAVGTAPDEAINRVVTEIEAYNEVGTFSREEKIEGVLVSKTWGERYKDNSGFLIEKTRVETGAATLTTIRTGHPGDESASEADRGRLESIQHPDGTVTLYSHELQGSNRLETVETGAGTLDGVTDGTRTVSTYTDADTLIRQTVTDIASGVLLSTKDAIAFDANDKVTRWAFDSVLEDYSETLEGCCGIDSTRTRDGVVTTYTRDGLKRPKTATSRGVTMTYTYGSATVNGTVFPTENITSTAGSLTLDQGTTVYDFAGNVIQEITPDLDGDGSPEITGTARDYSSHTTTTTNPDGGTLVSTNFTDGKTKSITGTATAPGHYTYGTHAEQGGGLLTGRAATATGPWHETYKNLDGRILKTTFSGSLVTSSNTYDSFGRLVASKDADGVTSLTAYNTKGEAYRQAIDINRNDQIDSADRVSDSIRDVVADSPIGAAYRSRNIVYDLSDSPVTISTSYRSIDGLSLRQESLGVANPSSSSAATFQDRSDGSWVQTATAPDGTQNTVSYQDWLPVTRSTLDSSGNTIESTTTGYDALRRPVTLTHSRTGLVTTAYAVNGLVSSVDEHGRVTSFAYDSSGRSSSATLPDSSVTHTSYWPGGQVKATWGSQTSPTVSLYDEQNRLTSLRTFRATDLTLAPDETTGNYDETEWIYNTRNQLERKEYADGNGTDYTYTPGGRLLTRTWARSSAANPSITTYTYNTAGELTTTDYSDTTPDVTATHDKLGRQQTVTNGLATTSFAYDPATLALDSETVSYDLDQDSTPELTRVIDRSRDTLGRDTGWQLMDGTTVENSTSYGYSETDGRLSTVSGGGSNSPGQFTYTHVPSSSMLASISGPAHTVENTYDPTRNTLLSRQNKTGTTIVSRYDYNVNAIGQRTDVSQAGTAFQAVRSITWGYDSLGQVTSADSTIPGLDRSYQYDTIGNRLKTANSLTLPGTANYTVNALNQYTAIGANTPTYDADGNATAYPLPADTSANSTLIWDAENRLIEVREAGTSVPLVSFVYDSQSRRIAVTQGTETTLYLYDGWNPIAEWSGGQTTTLTKTYLWGMDLSGTVQGAGGVGGLLAVTQEGSTYYPTYDGNGNVSEYLDSTGAVAAHYEYDPFGKIVVATGSEAADFSHRFSTKPLDQATGLYYYGYRYYDPETGRWPSRDPIGERGGVNLYGFVGNSGVNWLDYLGLLGCDDCDGKSLGAKKATKQKSYDCMDGESDEEFLDRHKIGGAIAALLLAANDVPTPGGNPTGTAPATGGVGSSGSAIVSGITGIAAAQWAVRQARLNNNNGYNKCVKYECKECKCCAIISKSWTVVSEGVAEEKTIAAARAAADKACL